MNWSEKPPRSRRVYLKKMKTSVQIFKLRAGLHNEQSLVDGNHVAFQVHSIAARPFVTEISVICRYQITLHFCLLDLIQ